jgi:hypothetical protein
VWTNNWAEASIRSLRSFLGGKCHVISCILQIRRYWSYYKLVGSDAKSSLANRKSMETGGAMWLMGGVLPADDSNRRFYVKRVTEGGTAVVDLSLPRDHCNVPHCRARPQILCAHYYAADLYANNGPYRGQWERVRRADEKKSLLCDLGQPYIDREDWVDPNDPFDDEGGLVLTAADREALEREATLERHASEATIREIAAGEVSEEEAEGDSGPDLAATSAGRPAKAGNKASHPPIRPESRLPLPNAKRSEQSEEVLDNPVLPTVPVNVKVTLHAGTRFLLAEGAAFPVSGSLKRRREDE